MMCWVEYWRCCKCFHLLSLFFLTELKQSRLEAGSREVVRRTSHHTTWSDCLQRALGLWHRYCNQWAPPHLTSLQVGLVRPLVVAAPGLAVGAVPVDQHHQRHQEQQVGDQQRVGDVDDLHSHSLLVTVSVIMTALVTSSSSLYWDSTIHGFIWE